MNETLKSEIREAIYQNTNGDITGTVLQEALLSIIDAIGDSTFLGIATQGTTPEENPDGKVFYFACSSGTYNSIFGGGTPVVLSQYDIYVFFYDEAGWHSSNISTPLQNMVNNKVAGVRLEIDGVDEKVNTLKYHGLINLYSATKVIEYSSIIDARKACREYAEPYCSIRYVLNSGSVKHIIEDFFVSDDIDNWLDDSSWVEISKTTI